MNFKLEFDFPSLQRKINQQDKLFFIGSCFAENIAEIFIKNYFHVFSNPNGIVYNPKSISTQLNHLIQKKNHPETDVFFHNEQWHSFQFHSEFSSNTKEELLHKINESTKLASDELLNANLLFITFGSAFVYLHHKTAVSNCHKLPAKQFEKVLLKKEDIVNEYILLVKKLQSHNPDLQIIFTVSPVKYIRDGIIENNLSKAILIQSVHEIISSCSNCFYFPAYEMVIDELRDYRFFKHDFAHPNEMAINYVWERLSSWMDNITLEYLKDIEEFLKFKNHRVLNPNQQKQHLDQITFRKNTIQKKYPTLKIDHD